MQNEICLAKTNQSNKRQENVFRSKANSAEFLCNIWSLIKQWMQENFFTDEDTCNVKVRVLPTNTENAMDKTCEFLRSFYLYLGAAYKILLSLIKYNTWGSSVERLRCANCPSEDLKISNWNPPFFTRVEIRLLALVGNVPPSRLWRRPY